MDMHLTRKTKTVIKIALLIIGIGTFLLACFMSPNLEIKKAVILLPVGIGAFLLACFTLSSNTGSLGSGLLRKLFNRASNSKLMGVGIGTAITAIIQSSGATTVMIIGFVNVGMMTLKSAATMIYGANIGTTVTALIVAAGTLGEKELPVSLVLSVFLPVGVIVRIFSKKDKYKKIGGILLGFGMLFLGICIMNEHMLKLSETEVVKKLLEDKNEGLWLLFLVLIGILITAITQSSSAVTAVVISMISSKLIDLQQGIYLAIGSNVGSCLPAIIAGWTANGKNARRAASIHLFFNVIGAFLFIIAGYVIEGRGGQSYGVMFGNLKNVCPDLFNPEMQLAVFHTTFNVVTVMVMLPLTNKLVHIVTKMFPDGPEEIENFGDASCINDHMLKTPSIAVQQVRNQFINMARVTEENFNLSCDMLYSKDLTELERFRDSEKQLNNLSRGVMCYIVKLSSMNLNARDLLYVSTVHYSITDLKHVCDYADNIVKYAEKFADSGDQLSPYAVIEIEKMKCLTHNLYEKVMSCYRQLDMGVLREAFDIEDQINATTDRIIEDHMYRLNSGICTTGAGAEYLFLISDIKKVANHFMNVGKILTTSLSTMTR